MIAATFVLSVQDALSRAMAEALSPWIVVAVRYWVFAGVALALASLRPGGVRAVAGTARPGLQMGRAILLAVETCAAVVAFTLIGLVSYHAVFASTPLIVAALAGPVLGERVGPGRWTAIAAGGCGVLILLQPSAVPASLGMALALGSAVLFALYSLLTRLAARTDGPETSFLWTGVVGAAVVTPLGLWHWAPVTPSIWAGLAALCATALLAHWLVIRCYAAADASAVQPFAYLHLIFAGALGVAVFTDPLSGALLVGAALVVAAGLGAWWLETGAARSERHAPKSPCCSDRGARVQTRVCACRGG